MDTSPIREAKRQWLNTVVETMDVSQREVAERLGIPYANFNAMLNGHRAVSDDTVDLVHQKLGIALPLSGYATSGNASRIIATLPLAVTVDRDGNENIVCVEAKAKAGYVNGLGDPAYLKKLPAYRLPYLGTGTFRDFQVDGFSMFNPETGQIMPNSHVVSRSISFDEIRSSRVHVVVTTNDLLIKRLYPEDGMVRLRSDNPDKIAYPDIEVGNEDIRELWYVERLITASIPPRSSTDELQELRGEMDTMRRQLHELQNKAS